MALCLGGSSSEADSFLLWLLSVAQFFTSMSDPLLKLSLLVATATSCGSEFHKCQSLLPVSPLPDPKSKHYERVKEPLSLPLHPSPLPLSP